MACISGSAVCLTRNFSGLQRQPQPALKSTCALPQACDSRLLLQGMPAQQADAVGGYVRTSSLDRSSRQVPKLDPSSRPGRLLKSQSASERGSRAQPWSMPVPSGVEQRPMHSSWLSDDSDAPTTEVTPASSVEHAACHVSAALEVPCLCLRQRAGTAYPGCHTLAWQRAGTADTQHVQEHATPGHTPHDSAGSAQHYVNPLHTQPSSTEAPGTQQQQQQQERPHREQPLSPPASVFVGAPGWEQQQRSRPGWLEDDRPGAAGLDAGMPRSASGAIHVERIFATTASQHAPDNPFL